MGNNVAGIMNAINNIVSRNINLKLHEDDKAWEKDMEDRKRSLDLQARFLKNAVMMGDVHTIEMNKDIFSKQFGKGTYEIATERAQYLRQLMGMGMYKPEKYQEEAAEIEHKEAVARGEIPEEEEVSPEEEPVVNPEDIPTADRIAHQREGAPPRFKTQLPTQPSFEIGKRPPPRFEITGFNMSDSGISMTMTKNQRAIDAHFYKYFQAGMANPDYTDLSPTERNDKVFGDYLAEFGEFPSKEAMSRIGFKEREPVYEGMFHRLKESKKNNPDFVRAVRQAFPNLSGVSLKTAINLAAVRVTGNEMNYMPKDVRDRLETLQAPPMSPELKQELSLMNIDPALASARERNLAMQRVNMREVIKSGQVAAEKEKQVFGVKLNQPVSDKSATDLGVPIGTTFQEVINKKLTPKTKKVQDAIESAKSALKIVNSLQKLSSRIHTGGRGGFTRLASGLRRKGQAIWDDASAAALYIKFREGYLALLTRAFGEKGPLREEDVQRIRKILPTLYASKEGAKAAWREITAIMQYRISAAKGAVKPYQKTIKRPKEASSKSVGRYNPETGKIEYYKD